MDDSVYELNIPKVPRRRYPELRVGTQHDRCLPPRAPPLLLKLTCIASDLGLIWGFEN